MTSTRAEIERRIADAGNHYDAISKERTRVLTAVRIETLHEVLALLPEPSGEVKEPVARYEIDQFAGHDGAAEMYECPNGDWVSYKSHQAAIVSALSTFQHQGEPVASDMVMVPRDVLMPFVNMPLYVYSAAPDKRFTPHGTDENWIGGGWFTAAEAKALREAFVNSAAPSPQGQTP